MDYDDDDDHGNFEDFLLLCVLISMCASCDTVLRGAKEFNAHFRNVNHESPLICGHNGCKRPYEHRTSLLRHLKDDHFKMGDQLRHENIEENSEENSSLESDDENSDGDAGENPNCGGEDEDNNQHEQSHNESSSDAEDELDLKKSAAKMVLDLRQTGGITNAMVNRCQDACYDLLKDVTQSLRTKTLKQQLNYFAREMGLVVPVTIFLGYRTDYRLDPDTNEYVPAQVSMTFEYIPIIETLKLILKNPKLRHLIEIEQASEDGVMRSYLDGSRSKTNPIITRHPRVIRIQLYCDDVETASALGSRTIIHKLLAIYFSIQNLPPEESSQLSSIFLLALAYSEDVKNNPGGYDKILYPFLEDLQKLESPEGVEINIDGEIYTLRATLVLLCADSLAAHDILGFLSPSARHFCRCCLISRPQFHANCRAVGERRTRENFDAHVALVKMRPAASTGCGVSKDCPLHKAAHDSATEDAPFDIFHDILEGVAHVVILLSLRSFIVHKKLLTVEDFNKRVSSFSYGIPDIKNKPSANFTTKRLFSSHFLQKGFQTWCLTRVLGFLIADVPGDDPYLKLINLLQMCMMIIFAPEIRPEDINRLQEMIGEFLGLFQQLFMNPIEILDEEEEAEVDDPVPAGVGSVIHKEASVNPINKLHHMSHLPQMIRDMGPPLRYWCMRYEARHHIFVKYAADMCNFINVPKSMAQMHQLCTLSGVLKNTLRKENVEVHTGEDFQVDECTHSDLLINAGLLPTEVVTDVRAAIVAGEDFRPGLFVVLNKTGPKFGIINTVYHMDGRIYFIVNAWRTEGFEERYCAYKVEPDTAAEQNTVQISDGITNSLLHELEYDIVTLQAFSLLLLLLQIQFNTCYFFSISDHQYSGLPWLLLASHTVQISDGITNSLLHELEYDILASHRRLLSLP
ncbi:Nucleoporin NUP145 [Frankliniella fusca]|uniref:Nucleoporin NUP145 n=1 Tax=Frankliniella fusca TaxID=407009 RepID=A0AAE1LF46_9NEOP|nr:Nucleoporin NUP145 [Frankliniella fusca]